MRIEGDYMDKKILVVDDAMFMRSIIRKILKEDGYTQVWGGPGWGKGHGAVSGKSARIWCFWISPCRDVPPGGAGGDAEPGPQYQGSHVLLPLGRR